MKNEKKYNLTLARAYPIKSGFWSTDIGPEEYDALQQVKLGGRLTLKLVKPESRKSDKSPHAYFEFMTKEEVEAFKSRAASNRKTSKSDDSDF